MTDRQDKELKMSDPDYRALHCYLTARHAPAFFFARLEKLIERAGVRVEYFRTPVAKPVVIKKKAAPVEALPAEKPAPLPVVTITEIRIDPAFPVPVTVFTAGYGTQSQAARA